MTKRTVFATVLVVLLWATAVYAQPEAGQSPATQTPAERSLLRRDMAQANARIDELPQFDWSFWPYLGLLVVIVCSVEGVRQWRRETEWRRRRAEADDCDLPLGQPPFRA